MNTCETVESIDNSISKKRKKKRKHRKHSSGEERIKSRSAEITANGVVINNSASYTTVDDCTEISSISINGGESTDPLLIKNDIQQIKSAIVPGFHYDATLYGDAFHCDTSGGDPQDGLSSLTKWPHSVPTKDSVDSIDSLLRCRSFSQLTPELPLPRLCTSASSLNLVADTVSQSAESTITVGSETQTSRQSARRGPTSTFSMKIKPSECLSIDESQLQTDLTNELNKCLPDKIARIMVITWNMAAISSYRDLLHDLLESNNGDEMCDLYLFCFQETTSNKQELLTRIQMTVGGHYVIYNYVENGSILCVLVGHKKFIWSLAVLGKASLSTRVTPITKGAAAISFQFFGNTILFLGSHFSSNEGRNNLRIEDYNSILYSKELIKSLTNPDMKIGDDESNLSHYFHNTFWAGDLNFRIVRDEKTVARLILSELECGDGLAFEELLEYDELINNQIAGLVFQEFEEGRIRFLPSYRFYIQTDEYNEKRTPSYTDRVLFRSHKSRGIECTYYNSVKSYINSDHKPVVAVMDVKVEPKNIEHFKSAGMFNQEIFKKCFDECDMKQKLTASNQPAPSTQSRACSIQ